MSKKKPGFLLYLDQKETIDELTDEEAGILLKAIFEYEQTKKTPQLNKVLKFIFLQLKKSLDRDEKKYNEICDQNRKNIEKRWNKEKLNKADTNEYDRIRTNTNYTNNKYKSKNKNKNKSKSKTPISNKLDTGVCNQATPDTSHTPSVFSQIVSYFNKVGIKEDCFVKNKVEFHFKNTKQTQLLIQNLLDQGYTGSDIYDVIFLKYSQWIENGDKNKIDMSQYYRPSTVLGGKFEEYLQEAKAKEIS